MLTRVRIVGLCIPIAAACGGAGAFECDGDAQCGAEGVCQMNGWCSFPDLDCASGHRYGDHAGEGLGGVCVEPSPDPTGSTGAAPGTAAPDDDDGGPTTLALEDGTTDPIDGSDTQPIGSSSTTQSTSASDDAPTGTEGTTGEPSDGLVLWFTFDDPLDLLADSSGNELHASCGGDQCPVPEVGVIDGAARFDGIDDHGHVDHVALLATNAGFTIALWASIDAFGMDYISLFGKPLGAMEDNSWEIGLPGGETVVMLASGTAAETVGVTQNWPELDEWHHVAGTWDGAQLRLYLDGQLVDTIALAAIEFDGHQVMIGADVDFEVDDNFLGGALDDVRLYDHALDDREIATLAGL